MLIISFVEAVDTHLIIFFGFETVSIVIVVAELIISQPCQAYKLFHLNHLDCTDIAEQFCFAAVKVAGFVAVVIIVEYSIAEG